MSKPVTVAGLRGNARRLAQWAKAGFTPCARCGAMIDSSGLDSLACANCPDGRTAITGQKITDAEYPQSGSLQCTHRA